MWFLVPERWLCGPIWSYQIAFRLTGFNVCRCQFSCGSKMNPNELPLSNLQVDKHHNYFTSMVLWLASARCYHRGVGSVGSGKKECWKHEGFLSLCLPGTQSPEVEPAKTQVALPKVPSLVPIALGIPKASSPALCLGPPPFRLLGLSYSHVPGFSNSFF